MTHAIYVPALGSADEMIRVGTWLVEIGQAFDSGDRLVELELTGMVYIVSAESRGRIQSVLLQPGDTVRQGDILAWMETADGV